jgi:hypothetical protein
VGSVCFEAEFLVGADAHSVLNGNKFRMSSRVLIDTAGREVLGIAMAPDQEVATLSFSHGSERACVGYRAASLVVNHGAAYPVEGARA